MHSLIFLRAEHARRFFSVATVIALTSSFVTPSAVAAEVVSKLSTKFESSDLYWKNTNRLMSQQLKIPFFFNAPYSSFLPLSEEMQNQRSSITKNAPVLINYRETTQYTHEQHAEDELGLRVIVVRGDNRIQTSKALAESGLLETGDVVLSFRPEWYGTLRYSHIQMGVSHAGIVYTAKGRDGNLYLKNLDMPLDDKHVGQGFFNSEHYLGANFLHIVRAKNLTAEQKSNLDKWLQLLASVGPKAYAAGKIRFNQDYAAPKFQEGKENKFVGDLARIALGIKNDSQLTNYCSEFIWSILSLRNCDPTSETVKQAFAKQPAPACIQEIFAPMPILGNVTTAEDISDSTKTIGMADGVPVLMQKYFSYVPDPAVRLQLKSRHIDKAVIGSANGKGDNISAGHKAVEEQLEQINPKFFEMLAGYFKLVTLPNADGRPDVQQLRAGFNAAQGRNYSPTSYMIHGVLPPNAAPKAFDYVGTLHFSKKIKTAKGLVDSYDLLRSIDVTGFDAQ